MRVVPSVSQRTATIAVANATSAPLELGRGEVRREGKKIAVLAWGSMLHPALVVGEKLNATVVNMRFIKPLDEPLLREIALTHDALVTVEEASVQGSAGSAVAEFVANSALKIRVIQLGLPDTFIDQGDPALMLASVGLDAAGIEASVRKTLASAM